MLIVPRTESSIEFLVSRRFPFAHITRGRANSSQRLPDDKRDLLQIEAYERELRSLPEVEFQGLLDREKRKAAKEISAQAEREEQERFFNQPQARADFAHWSKTAYWTLDEATALSFGKDPHLVDWKSIKGLVSCSKFAARYAQLRELVDRARVAGQLSELIAPGFYTAWAKQNGIVFPRELEIALIERGTQVANWKSLYQAAHQDLAVANKQLYDLDMRLAQMTTAASELRQIVESQQAQLAKAGSAKPLNT